MPESVDKVLPSKEEYAERWSAVDSRIINISGATNIVLYASDINGEDGCADCNNDNFHMSVFNLLH
jgi:hypothetical protein